MSSGLSRRGLFSLFGRSLRGPAEALDWIGSLCLAARPGEPPLAWNEVAPSAPRALARLLPALRSAGLDGYMLKPLDPKVLAKKLADIFCQSAKPEKS